MGGREGVLLMINEVTDVETTLKLKVKDDCIFLDLTIIRNHTLDLILFIFTRSQPFYSVLFYSILIDSILSLFDCMF